MSYFKKIGCFFVNGAAIAMLMTSIIIFGFYVIVFLKQQKVQQHCSIILVYFKFFSCFFIITFL
jgi:hypothetical protein